MTIIDKTGASEQEFRARVAPFEADDAERVETVARAMWASVHSTPWSHAEFRAEADDFLTMAAAAVAALPPSPAEEAAVDLSSDAVRWSPEKGARPAVGYTVELGGETFTQAQWEVIVEWRRGTDMPALEST